jgi:hypothetical protein
MTPEEVYEKAIEALGDIQFIDNTYLEGLAERKQVQQVLSDFYKDMLQLLLEKQTKVIALSAQVIELQLANLGIP